MEFEEYMMIKLTDTQLKALKNCGEDSDCDKCPCRFEDDTYGCLLCQVYPLEGKRNAKGNS